MSVEIARALLEGMMATAGEPVRSGLLRVLEELETPEERRKRYERDKKRAQRANGKKDPNPPPETPPDRSTVPHSVPAVSPVVPAEANATSLSSSSSDLSSLSRSPDPSPLSLLPTEKPSKTARGARAGARTPMPDPEQDPQGFEAFVRRWSLPLSPDLSRFVPDDHIGREAAKFMAYALKNGKTYTRWDWAWREWLARSGDFANGSGVHRVAPEAPRRRPEPAPEPTPFTPQAAVRAAAQAHIESLVVPPLPNGGKNGRR